MRQSRNLISESAACSRRFGDGPSWLRSQLRNPAQGVALDGANFSERFTEIEEEKTRQTLRGHAGFEDSKSQ